MDAMELAYDKRTSEFYFDVMGKPTEKIKIYIEKYREKLTSISSIEEIETIAEEAKRLNFTISISKPAVEKEEILRNVQEKVVKRPPAIKIIEIRLEIFLRLIYVPIYRFECKYIKGAIKPLHVDGIIGKVLLR